MFKTAWFSKAARKAFISDPELCAAIAEVMLGQADDLGGGVYKKRLSKNNYRSIVLARVGRFGYMSTCLQRITRQTLRTANSFDCGPSPSLTVRCPRTSLTI